MSTGIYPQHLSTTATPSLSSQFLSSYRSPVFSLALYPTTSSPSSHFRLLFGLYPTTSSPSPERESTTFSGNALTPTTGNSTITRPSAPSYPFPVIRFPSAVHLPMPSSPPPSPTSTFLLSPSSLFSLHRLTLSPFVSSSPPSRPHIHSANFPSHMTSSPHSPHFPPSHFSPPRVPLPRLSPPPLPLISPFSSSSSPSPLHFFHDQPLSPHTHTQPLSSYLVPALNAPLISFLPLPSISPFPPHIPLSSLSLHFPSLSSSPLPFFLIPFTSSLSLPPHTHTIFYVEPPPLSSPPSISLLISPHSPLSLTHSSPLSLIPFSPQFPLTGTSTLTLSPTSLHPHHPSLSPLTHPPLSSPYLLALILSPSSSSHSVHSPHTLTLRSLFPSTIPTSLCSSPSPLSSHLPYFSPLIPFPLSATYASYPLWI
ncbi:hypothetical protein C7M84_011185 [Penaeus vannamei]|uniref:Uncharacterized protein n=1 Tax=Penaeus vannamei TaxID=6689 RepID=A0A3R7SQ65_PENVA|nr:hypothetical protein C7M84_011185 [Penaeus vannamei]